MPHVTITIKTATEDTGRDFIPHPPEPQLLGTIVAEVIRHIKWRSWSEYNEEEALPEIPWKHPALITTPQNEDTGGEWFTVTSKRQSKKNKN